MTLKTTQARVSGMLDPIVRLGRGLEYPLIIQRGKGRNAEFIAGVHFADKPTRRELRQWRDAIQRGIEPNAIAHFGKVSDSVKPLVGHFDYVRRCKSARGEETHKTTHAARGSSTLCGKPLGGMWYVLSAWGRTPDEVDCRKCRRALMANKVISK